MRADLTAGRDAITAARREALAGDLSRAQDSFGRAEVAFQRASDRAGNPVGTLARAIPWLGNSADTLAAMASAGTDLSAAGSTMAGALAELPDGVGSLAPSDGRLPLERYAGLADAVDSASAGAAEAATTLADAPASFVPQLLSKPRWDAEAQAASLATDLHGVAQLLRGAEGFAGGDGARRYLVVAQNPAELRGTGGIWGAYAIMTLDRGRASVSRSHPTQALTSFPAGRVESPSEDYARNYDQYGGAGSWQNMNTTPDFPAAAQAALANYELGEGDKLDGVIAADPFALQALLEVTGPVSVPGTGPISADNVVDVTTNRAYSSYRGPTERKEVLGAVATDVLGQFLAMDEQGLARIRALATAASDGHLKVYAADQTMQDGLRVLGVDGALSALSPGDVLAATVNNGSGSKVDYYTTRNVSYEVTLGGDHESVSTAIVSITNGAPTHGQPRYVIGPFIDGARAGDVVPVTSVWCHAPCDLRSATRDGTDVPVTNGTENGISWLQDYRTIPSGKTGDLALTWHSTDTWEGNSSGGTYRLTYLGQPTIRPTDVSVTIHAPQGTDIVWTSEPMAVDGNTASWQGTASGRLTLEVRFRAPLPMRLVRDVTRPLFG